MTSVGQRAQKSSMEDESTARTEDFQSQNITDHHDKLRSRLHARLKKTFRLKSSFSATFRSAPFQLSLIAFISFLCPGMYNALNGLGGSGLIQADPANKANVALYSTFSVAGFFAGIVTNKLGVKIALGIGGLGYALYASSFLCYKHTGNSGFLLFAGAQLGICAGVFWAAQSMTAIAYPTERSTGRSISWFWVVYNLGAVLGSMIALGQNLHSGKNDISDSTFYIIIALSLLGTLIALFLSESKNVLRTDGSQIILNQSPTWKSEISGCLEALRHDYYILLLFPMFFASNFFYPYQFNTFNLENFTIRTRSLNNALYWISEMAGASIIGPALDSKRFRRATKAKLALLMLLLVTCGVWGGAFVCQIKNDMNLVHMVKKDFLDEGYAPQMILYMSFGLFASAYQTCLLWFLRSLTDDSRKIANFAGFLKGVQSAGQAVSFRVNTLSIAPTHELFLNWGLLSGSVLIAAPLILYKVEDHKSEMSSDEMAEA